jgi:hypothetical protein
MSNFSTRNRPVKQKRNSQLTPGTPGYRLRSGRTGLDPMENAREAAFLEGKFIRRLFTGRLRIKSRLWLYILGITGVALIAPLGLYVIPTLARFNFEILNLYITNFTLDMEYLLLFALIGVVLLINVALSVRQNRKKTSTHLSHQHTDEE